MKPFVDLLKSRSCDSVPATYSPGTVADSNAGVCRGNRSLIVSSGRAAPAKMPASNAKPVHAITRS